MVQHLLVVDGQQVNYVLEAVDQLGIFLRSAVHAEVVIRSYARCIDYSGLREKKDVEERHQQTAIVVRS